LLLKCPAHYAYRRLVVTLGVDLASAAKRTAVCWIEWDAGRAEVVRLESRADDDALVEAIAEVDRAGIDVPFGWPEDFVRAVAEYSASGIWPAAVPQPSAAPKQLQFRETDRFVHKITGAWPLSVSSDRIAIPAMRAAALFSRLAASGHPVARDGSGKVVEVYPAAALRMWGFNALGYKRKKNRAARCSLMNTVFEQTGRWLSMDAKYTAACEDSDDAFDALIAGLGACPSNRL